MNKIIGIISVLAMLTGCATQKIIVVQGDFNPKRTFTVIPAGYLDSDIEFAGRIEQYLVHAGLTLLERPPIRFMTSDNEITTGSAVYGGASAAGRSAGSSLSASVKEPGKLIDIVSMYPDSKATHIVATYRSSHRIRIIEKATGGIVANIDLHRCQNESDSGGTDWDDACEKALYSSLVYAKMVDEPIEEKQCALVTRGAKQPINNDGHNCPAGTSWMYDQCYPTQSLLGH